MMNLEEYHINQLLQQLHDDTGIAITHANRWQVQNRIRALCRTLTYSIQELRHRISTSERHILYPKIIDCIVVQESFFFRDDHFYEQLQDDVIPKLFETFRNININIWSAACAEGQEPYSISILLQKMFPHNNIPIYGSDISATALHTAQKGSYLLSSLKRNLSQEDINLYFHPCQAQTERYKLKDLYKKNICFFEHNLIHPTGKHRFYHLIILRNVLMYFSEAYRKICIDNLKRSLKKGGVLILSNPNTQIIQC